MTKKTYHITFKVQADWVDGEEPAEPDKLARAVALLMVFGYGRCPIAPFVKILHCEEVPNDPE